MPFVLPANVFRCRASLLRKSMTKGDCMQFLTINRICSVSYQREARVQACRMAAFIMAFGPIRTKVVSCIMVQ